MTRPISLVLDRSKTNRWQAAQILAAIQVFAVVIEPRAAAEVIYFDDDLDADQIGWTLVMSEQAGAKLLEYFAQLTAGTGA